MKTIILALLFSILCILYVKYEQLYGEDRELQESNIPDSSMVKKYNWLNPETVVEKTSMPVVDVGNLNIEEAEGLKQEISRLNNIINEIKGEMLSLKEAHESEKVQLMNEKDKKPSIIYDATSVKNITVPSMCRCPTKKVGIKDGGKTDRIFPTSVIQSPSIGNPFKRKFWMRPSECHCVDNAEVTTDDYFLSKMSENWECKPNLPDSKFSWDAMPDLGIDENIHLFLGVLSYMSPSSLNATLQNWKQYLFPSTALEEIYIQLNKRSPMDDEVMNQNIHEIPFNVTLMGTSDENLHPGRAISRFCRAAEQKTGRSDNLLMFLEKDWNIRSDIDNNAFSDAVQSAKILSQRGVPYIRLTEPVNPGGWPCVAENYKWLCNIARKHRYTNLPSILRCDWFLKNLEPFALWDDSSLFGCRNGFREKRYIDWEEMMQDGRVAWSETNWVLASSPYSFFYHSEIDN